MMRLIDADLLRIVVENLLDSDELGLSEWAAVDTAIVDAPTINPAAIIEKPVHLDADKVAEIVMKKLVRRGKWEVAGFTTHFYICSICGKPGDCYDNYCRSCGSRMDGEDNETD